MVDGLVGEINVERVVLVSVAELLGKRMGFGLLGCRASLGRRGNLGEHLVLAGLRLG